MDRAGIFDVGLSRRSLRRRRMRRALCIVRCAWCDGRFLLISASTRVDIWPGRLLQRQRLCAAHALWPAFEPAVGIGSEFRSAAGGAEPVRLAVVLVRSLRWRRDDLHPADGIDHGLFRVLTHLIYQ